MDNIDNEKYDKYDLLLHAILLNYQYKSKDASNIIFTHINPSNKSHLLLLKIAEIDNARSFDSTEPQKGLYLKVNFFKRICMRFGRESKKYYHPHITHSIHGSRTEIDCTEFMNFTDRFRVNAHPEITWDEIYDEYYSTKGKHTK